MTESKSLRIIVIDENPVEAEQIVQNFNSKGHSAKLAQLSDDGLKEKIVAKEYDLLFLDADYHKNMGLEFAKNIRALSTSNPEIIFVSQEPQKHLFECHQIGACHVLKKPLNLEIVDEIANSVRRDVVERRRFERMPMSPSLLGGLYGEVLPVPQGDSAKIFIEVSDIGRGGFFYKVPPGADAPKVGQILEFELKLGMLPEYSFKGEGIVRWTRATVTEFGAGVEFLSIPSDSEILIRAFVDLFKVRPFVPTGI